MAPRFEEEGAAHRPRRLGFDVLGEEALEERHGVGAAEPHQLVEAVDPPRLRAGGPVLVGDVPVGDRGGHSDLALATAASAAAALSMVSWYSASGSESATIPAPAWIQAVSPAWTTVRRQMAVSTFPEKSM